MADDADAGAAHVGGGLPSPHQLKAAVRAARVVRGGPTGRTAARSAYVELPTGGLLTGDDLGRAEDWLVELRLLARDEQRLDPSAQLVEISGLGDDEAAEMLLAVALGEQPPVWLSGAARNGKLSDELIPDDDARLLEGIMPDPERREAMLLALAQRFDAGLLAEIGAIGEEHVVQCCRNALNAADRPDLADQVRRVSKISDALGYDVTSPSLSAGAIRLEVKTTSGVGETVEIHLSRNEARTGLRDSSWVLVVCRVDSDRNPSVAGWCRADVLKPLLPKDSPEGGRWESVAIALPCRHLSTHLPPLD